MPILYDTDFLYNLFYPSQANHLQAISLYEKVKDEPIIILRIVKQELATVLSHKENQQLAIDTINDLENLEIQYIDLTEETELGVWQIFKSFLKKNISFVDCANLYFASKFKFTIASFDKFYPKEHLIS